MSSSPFSSSPDHHRRTTSQQSFPPQGDTPNSGRTSTVGGGGRSTVLTNNNYNRAASVSGGLGGGGGDRASHIGRNSSIGAGSRSGINTNNINGKTSSSASNSAQQQQQQQLFEAGGAGAARRALLYDVERHKLESLPLTRLFRFLADSPHWLGTGGGIDGATSTGSAYEPTEGGDHSNAHNNNNNTNNKNNKRPSSAAVVSAPRRSSSSHMIKNLVVASPEGGRHVSKRQRDIDRARMASVLADGHDDLIIPDTIVWEASIPRGWFYTSFDGQDGRAAVQRRSVDIGVIEKQWTEGLPPNAVAASYYTVAARDPAASLADKDTPLLQFQFLRACELSKFLHVQATQTSGSDCAAILQQFTYPLHAHNVVIQAVWSPRVLNITVRQNINPLHDGGLDPNSRACTFEGSPHLSQELRPTTRLYGQVESAVHSLTKHFAAVDLKNRIVRIVAYFKVDKESRLNLLYVPSIRVMRTSIIEKPIGLKANPFFSAFRVALDVAVEYETLTTNANAFTSGIGNNDANLTNAASGLSASPMLGGGGSRIRKSASNKNKNNNEGNSSSNVNNNKPISSKKPGNFEGSRLLADALDLAVQEMHLEKYQTQQNNNNTKNSPNRNQDSNSNESGMFENKNHQSPNTTTTTASQRKGDEESIQFKLSHSPVIGQQRADLVEIVMEIVRNSHHAKEAQTAVTKAFRHAATPAARDALKWAAVESGFLCHDDDSYSHPFFEVGPELMEIMKFVCEDYREEEEEEGGEDDDDDDDDGGEDKQEDDGMMDRSLIGGNNSRTVGGVNNNNKNDNSGGDSSGGFKFRNNQHYQHPHPKVSSNNHNAASSPSTGPTSPGMASHEGDDHSGILLQPQADSEQNGTKSVVSSPPPPPPLPPSLAKSGQQGNNNNNHKSKNNHNHNNSLRSNKSPTSAASSQRMKQSFNQHPFANTNENNNSNSFVSGGGGGGVIGPCWKKFAQVLKSGVSDFLYEVTDNGVQSAVALTAASTSVFGGANNVPFDFSGALGSISADAHQICEIVLELFLNFNNNNNNNNNTSYSYSNLLHRVLPLAIGSLWKDVAVRDAVAILSCVIFGIMSVQNNSVNPQSQGKNSNGDGGAVEDDQFYLNLIENDRKEKEKTKERKRQQWIKQQQIDEEEFYATKQKQQRESNNNNNNNLATSMSSSTDETNNKGLAVPLSPTSSITSPTSSKPTQQQQQKSSLATTFVPQPQPEDISMYFEGLRTAVPLFKPNHIETIKLKPEGALDLQGNATTYQLVVSVKNATRMGLECQVRKLLGDVLLSEENSKSILANCFLDLLLPEVLEERRKLRILLLQQQQQQQQQNQSPTTTTTLANKTKKIISPTVTMTASSVSPSSHVRRNTIKSSNTPSIGSSPILVYNSKTNFDFMTTSPILQANNNNNNNNKANSAALGPQVKEKATTNIKTPKNIFHASSSDDEL